MYLLVLTRVTDLILKDSEGSSKEEKKYLGKIILIQIVGCTSTTYNTI